MENMGKVEVAGGMKAGNQNIPIHQISTQGAHQGQVTIGRPGMMESTMTYSNPYQQMNMNGVEYYYNGDESKSMRYSENENRNVINGIKYEDQNINTFQFMNGSSNDNLLPYSSNASVYKQF